MSVRRRGTRAYQVRVAPFPAKTLPTRAAAEKCELELLLRRSEGDRYVEKPTTLGQEIEGWLARRRARQGRGPTMRFYERSAVIWSEFAHIPVAALRRGPVEDFIVKRGSEREEVGKERARVPEASAPRRMGARAARRRGRACDRSDCTRATRGQSADRRGALRAGVVDLRALQAADPVGGNGWPT